MVETYFTSDLHLGHENIIKYCERPFKDLQDMNIKLINKWNEVVKEEDIVFHIGDFCFKNTKGGKPGEGTLTNAQTWKEKLNGTIIHFKGNHDGNNSLNSKLISAVIRIGGQDVFLTHKPENYNKDYRINLVGHVHEKWKIQRKGKNILVNVGVDQWKFRPVKWKEIDKAIQSFLKEEKKDE